jgi:hypothetical protein
MGKEKKETIANQYKQQEQRIDKNISDVLKCELPYE